MQGLWKKAIDQKERQRVGYRDEQETKDRKEPKKSPSSSSSTT